MNEWHLLDHIKYPILFIFKQIALLIPFLFLIRLITNKIIFKVNLKDEKLIFLIFINLVPLILMLLTSIIFGSRIRTMWMAPFYLFFGTFFIYLFQKQINFKKIKSFMIGIVILFFISPIIYSYVSISNEDKRTDYPGKEIASKVQLLWNKDYDKPIEIVIGNEWNAGNLSYHLKSRPKWIGFMNKENLDLFEKYLCIDNVCVGTKK